MRAILIMVTYNNGESKKVLMSSVQELKETRRDVKLIRGFTIKL